MDLDLFVFSIILSLPGRLPVCHLQWHISDYFGVTRGQRTNSPAVLTPVFLIMTSTNTRTHTRIRTWDVCDSDGDTDTYTTSSWQFKASWSKKKKKRYVLLVITTQFFLLKLLFLLYFDKLQFISNPPPFPNKNIIFKYVYNIV